MIGQDLLISFLHQFFFWYVFLEFLLLFTPLIGIAVRHDLKQFPTTNHQIVFLVNVDFQAQKGGIPFLLIDDKLVGVYS